MTDPRPPLSDDDLSALLDGEAAPDVAARVRDDPAAAARLEALRAAATAIHDLPVTPLPAATVDDLVGRALAAADGAATGPAPDDDPDAVVAPLRPRGGASVPRWLVAAAVVLLVAVGLSLVWSGRDDRTETASTPPSAQDQASEEALDEDGAGDGDGATSGGVQSEEVPAATPDQAIPGRGTEVTDLGEFATLDDLRTSLARAFPTDRAAVDGAAAPSAAAVLRCQQLMTEVFVLEGEPTHIGQATVDGDPYLVYEFDAVSATDGTTPTTFLTVNDPTSCDAERSFERTPG